MSIAEPTTEAKQAPSSTPAGSGPEPRRPRRLIVQIFNTLLDALLVVLVATTLTFIAIQLVPGDPVDRLLTGVFDITPELRDRVAEHYGLDQSVLQQYFTFIGNLFQGDLGVSYQRQAPVLDLILQELPPTLELTIAALTLAVLGALIASVLTAGRRPLTRGLVQGLELTAVSIPSFWLGILLMLVFAFWIPIFPAFGTGHPLALVLPAVTLAISIGGSISQILRERLEHTLHEPFVTSIRARGVGETELRLRYLTRHASIPALTISGLIFGALLSGTAIIETLFSRPGLGRLVVLALQDRDLPLILGIVVFAALVFVVINTIVDLLYPLIDPRLREG